jgi:hypothetical protein
MMLGRGSQACSRASEFSIELHDDRSKLKLLRYTMRDKYLRVPGLPVLVALAESPKDACCVGDWGMCGCPPGL